MCEKCTELKQAFLDAEGICPKQTAYNEYDKQRKKCAKALGSLAPEPPKAVVTKERKPRKKKEKEEPAPAPAAEPEPAKTESKKKEKVVPAKKSPCKFYYRGGLCSNSRMEKPFCVGEDKCDAN